MVKTFDEVQRAILRVLQLLAQDADSLLETDVVLLAPTASANNR